MESPFNRRGADDSCEILQGVVMRVESNLSRGGCDCLPILEESISLLEKFSKSFLEKQKERLFDLKNRLSEGTLNLAVLGQFKRGKSTLLNSLLGIDILPTSVVPLTAIPTFIKSGKKLSVKICFNFAKPPEVLYADSIEKARDFLAEFVSEEKNPKNKKDVREVLVFLPDIPILEKKVVFIDTPGIGSTYRHNTEATLNFLPQCDAALFVLSADPPITEVEVEFLKSVEDKVPRLFFLLNKVDYLDSSEIKEVFAFLVKTLKSAGIKSEIEIFPVSAKLGLKGKILNDKKMVKESGIADIENRLIGFLASEKTGVLNNAVKVKISSILNEVLLNTEIELNSLKMPLSDLEEKMRFFEKSIEKIEDEKMISVDLLEGERKRLHVLLENYCSDLRKKADEYFEGILLEEISSFEGNKISESAIREKIAEVIPVFFEREMGRAAKFFEERVNVSLGKHREKANDLINGLKTTAADLFDVSFASMNDKDLFKIVREPYWVSHKWNNVFSPIPPAVVDKVLPLKIKKNRILKRMREQINSLCVHNIENLRWSIYQSINDTFRGFVSQLDDKFEETLQSTFGAVKEVVSKRKNKREEIDFDISQLEDLKKSVVSLLERIN